MILQQTSNESPEFKKKNYSGMISIFFVLLEKSTGVGFYVYLSGVIAELHLDDDWVEINVRKNKKKEEFRWFISSPESLCEQGSRFTPAPWPKGQCVKEERFSSRKNKRKKKFQLTVGKVLEV